MKHLNGVRARRIQEGPARPDFGFTDERPRTLHISIPEHVDRGVRGLKWNQIESMRVHFDSARLLRGCHDESEKEVIKERKTRGETVGRS